jgi:hypothetical protein
MLATGVLILVATGVLILVATGVLILVATGVLILVARAVDEDPEHSKISVALSKHEVQYGYLFLQ